MPVSDKPRRPFKGNKYLVTSREAIALRLQLAALTSVVQEQGKLLGAIHNSMVDAMKAKEPEPELNTTSEVGGCPPETREVYERGGPTLTPDGEPLILAPNPTSEAPSDAT